MRMTSRIPWACINAAALIALALSGVTSATAEPPLIADERVTNTVTSHDGPAPDSANTGSSSWTLNVLVPLLIDSDTGSGKQDTSLWYSGQTACVCVGHDWVGFCNHYLGVGDWYVEWMNTRYEGTNSHLQIDGTVTEAVYHVVGESTGYISETCNINLQGAYALGQAIAVAKANTFHDISGHASAYTRIGVSVPLTGIGVAVPGVLVLSSGSASWTGGPVHWDFSYRGDAHLVSPLVPSIGTLSATGRSYA